MTYAIIIGHINDIWTIYQLITTHYRNAALTHTEYQYDNTITTMTYGLADNFIYRHDTLIIVYRHLSHDTIITTDEQHDIWNTTHKDNT
jgi:hypothetical protein